MKGEVQMEKEFIIGIVAVVVVVIGVIVAKKCNKK